MKHIILVLIPFIAILNYSCQSTDETIEAQSAKLNVNLKLSVGDVPLQNAESSVTISGYDEQGSMKWSESFQFNNSIKSLPVQLGFQKYVIETEKWGLHQQKQLNANELWNGRADGPTPVTHTLSISAKPKKLVHYTESFEYPELGFQPQSKVKFEYNEHDQLVKKIFFNYHPVYKSLIEERYLVLTYNNNRVDKIFGYFTGVESPYVQYTYSYLPNEAVSSITENNFSAGVNSIVNFIYDTPNNKITATYTFSNGSSFSYELNLSEGNLVADKTVKGTEICNTGAYTYDDGINPLSLLGYVDYNLSNFSINNRLTEDVNYLACAYPTLIPQSHTYVYDEAGYPITATTVYFSTGTHPLKSQKLFIYK